MKKYFDEGAFTNDLLVEILKRLPVDKLLDLKCVCKHWNRIISSSYFRKIYLYEITTHGNPPSTPLGFYRSDAEYAFLPTNLQARSNLADFYFKKDGFYFIDSHNGLLLFHNFDQKVYRVCNPLTKQFHEFDQPYPNGKEVVVAFEAPLQECGIEVLNSYVLTFLVGTGLWQWHLLTISSGDTVWKEYEFWANECIYFQPLECAVVINGMYYWKSLLTVLALKLPRVESFKLIPLPERNDATINISTVLGESKDGLLQYARSDSVRIVVWVVIQNYDSGDYEQPPWVLRYTIHLLNMGNRLQECNVFNAKDISNIRDVKLVAFHPWDSEIVFILLNNTIISYCFHNKRVEIVRHVQDTHKKSGVRDTYDPPWEWSRKIVPYFTPPWAASFLESPLIKCSTFSKSLH